MSQPVRPEDSRLSFWLDLRTCIAVLFVIYGAVCLVWGLAFTDAAELGKSGGIRLNLWTGIGMLAVGAAFAVWAALRPVRADERGRRPAAPAPGDEPPA
ncbi:hypothetical protein [Streptomyces tremellae]|uniref:Integral membrane protein n=1 Tax=Streptomyces tremellae TaxID=1124239 RepID=A0ABP7EWD2_9ACTN